MEYRIHPDLQDPNLIFIANIFSIFCMILLLVSYKRYRNATSLIFAFACLFDILGHGSLALSVKLLPDNLNLQIWIANVGAVMLFYCIYAYLALAIIYIKFRNISPLYVLFILVLGVFAILPSLLNFELPTPLPGGGYDFHRTFAADFIQFMLGIILFMGLFSAFVSGYQSAKDKIPLLLLASGVSTTIISMPLIAVSESVDLAILFHYLVIFGWILTTSSFLLVAYKNRKSIVQAQKA